jgi:ABC-type uncharacterized transport system ATPase subunit
MSPPALLAASGIRKRFGTLEALAGIDLEFHAGEIHAVLGENGAGKSTLMHVLGGFVRPDAGTVCVDGAPVAFRSPGDARAAGIGMVHQHFALVDALTVAENLALSLSASAWWLDRRRIAIEAAALAARAGLELGPPEARVGELPIGARQRLEIINALASASRVTILDEPTAVLAPQEVRQLFQMLRQLRAQGRAVIFITHKLREVNQLADRVTIMRRGLVVCTAAVGRLSEGELAHRMVGDVVPAVKRPASPPGAPVLRVSNLSAHDRRGLPGLIDVSFEVGAGEILGVAGVDGNGQRELFDVLVGVQRPDRGSVRVADRLLADFTARAALAAGIGHIPPDRQHDGLALPMSVAENFVLHRGILRHLSRRGALPPQRVRQFAVQLAARYGIRASSLDRPVRLLSGGNQQKVVVARELSQQPRVLITVNPTRGLDVAAAAAVASALLQVTRQGCAVLLISTDLDEVLDLSDHIRVLSRGRLSTVLEPPVDMERLGRLMAGTAA